ncbi:MAG TPA: hypothetical protein VK211_10145 [Kamptonema sp.]|nr:hypothetical protein [Kamptonema sp.]
MDIKELEEKLARVEEEFTALNATAPFKEWVGELLDKIQSDYEFYEQRAKTHYLKHFEVNEALRNAVKSAKSNNEHVRKLKGRINEVIERWFQQ